MKEWFQLSEKDRKEVLIQTSASSGLPPAAIEKDWWVMIALQAIFNSEYANHIVFKGGTSLSKAWKIIERFSEDIDLAIDRSYFGFGGPLNRSQVKTLRKASCKFISEEFIKKIETKLTEQDVKEFELDILSFEESDTDPIAIELKYNSLTETNPYLKPRILIEISSRSLRNPFEYKHLQSIISEKYPSQTFIDKPIEVPTVLPSRTFLEKIFLLHEEFQKPPNRPIRSNRMTRHLYDISKLMDTEFYENAITDFDLYNNIIEHRKMLTKISWVDYSKHQPKTLNFIPPDSIIADWEMDYSKMQESMFYGITEPFDELISKLKKLNQKFNIMG